jgi:hypothetical protein
VRRWKCAVRCVKSSLGRSQVDERGRIEDWKEGLVQSGPLGDLIASLDNHGVVSFGPWFHVDLDETVAWEFAAVNFAPSRA